MSPETVVKDNVTICPLKLGVLDQKEELGRVKSEFGVG